MPEFRDKYPQLPQAVDIGGDRYFMGPQKPIEIGFKSRQDFLNSFGPNAEYYMRKYMPIRLRDICSMRFDPPEDKAELIKILEARVKQLQQSAEFTSSIIKNIVIQRSYINILQIINRLKGPKCQGEAASPQEAAVAEAVSENCNSAKEHVRQIPQEKFLWIMLEIAWYLLHPDKVPKKVECDWARLLKELDTVRLGEIVAQIKEEEDKKGIKPSGKPFNYFKKINLDSMSKAEKIENALDQARDMAIKLMGEDMDKQMKDRLVKLLNVLAMKKYLNGQAKTDEERMKIIDAPETISGIEKSMIINPMSGGDNTTAPLEKPANAPANNAANAAANGTEKPVNNAPTNTSTNNKSKDAPTTAEKEKTNKAIDKPLGVAMMPFFDYFKNVFDPVYSVVETGITTYNTSKNTTKKVLIPQLATILHICNNIIPTENTAGGGNSYGVYRITNVNSEIINYFKSMLGSTQQYIEKFTEKKPKYTFVKQLLKLPKVRLSSLINQFDDGYKDPETLPYLQFFVVDSNLSLPEQAGEMGDDAFKALGEFFNTKDLYILCTDDDRISENIPMNMYQINYTDVDVANTGFKIDNLPDNYFNKNKEPEKHLEKLVELKEYVVFNDAELALSIFIAFKELMPK